MTSSNPNCHLSAPSVNTFMLGVKASIYKFGAGQGHIQSITSSM